MPSDADLQQDLSLALHTITETSQSIRFADTKAGALAGIQALMVTVLAARHGAGHGLAVQLLHTACLFGVLVSALLLAAGQMPRLFENSDHRSRVSFPALGRMRSDQLRRVPSLEHRHEEVWRQAASLARIAVTKFRWLTHAAAGTALTLTCVLVWLCWVTWSSAG